MLTRPAIMMATAVALLGVIGEKPRAATVEEFYRDRTVSLSVGTTPGGGYDATARLIAQHLGRHIPGRPSFIVKNMPGAAGLVLTNYIYNAAAKDGSEIGMPQNSIVFEPMFKILAQSGANVQFEPLKFRWIGNPVVESMVLFSWHSTPFKTWKDLLEREMVTGSSGLETDNAILPSILARATGAKFRMVPGYKGPGELFFALERGEVQAIGGAGYSGLVATKADWLKDRKLNILVQFGLKPDPRIADVPLAIEFARTDEDRRAMELIFSKYQLTRSIFAPPGTPEDRVEALRSAFDRMTADPAFITDAARLGTDITLVRGVEIEDVIRNAYTAPPAVVERARALVAPIR